MQTIEHKQLSTLIEEGLSALNLPDTPGLLYDPVRYTLDLPGKRVRPFLTLTGCGIAGGEPEEALSAAIALELLHNFTLLHDDIMDAAETRRGEDSVYKKWDANTAILSGDAMYAKAFKQLQYYGRNRNYSKEQYAQIIDIFLDSAESVCEGQAYDLEFEDRMKVSLDEYLHMIEGKTAALISGSLAIGGAVAGAKENILQQLYDIGQTMGIAFQIQDDLLDVIADPEKFGKQRGGDIMEGKKTYLSLLALQRCDNEQAKVLQDILRSNNNSENDVIRVVKLYKELDVISSTRLTINEYYQKSMDLVDNFEASSYKDQLISFLNRLISREF